VRGRVPRGEELGYLQGFVVLGGPQTVIAGGSEVEVSGAGAVAEEFRRYLAGNLVGFGEECTKGFSWFRPAVELLDAAVVGYGDYQLDRKVDEAALVGAGAQFGEGAKAEGLPAE